MNGLFAWALRGLGFRVDLLAGAVGHATVGDRANGNHLVLLVHLEQPWVADVGFGDGFLEPLPLRPGSYRQGFLEFRLERAGDLWTVINHQYGAAPSYDFTLAPTTLDALTGPCHALQTSPESGFVRKTVCQRHTPEGVVTLRGAVLRRVTERGVAQRVLEGAADFDAVLRGDFDLRLPEARFLWTQVWDRHRAWRDSEERP
jgi:N-hydroxyarylamine O-acetyltransferase